MLSSYRVLDLTDERGMFCGYVLGQLGADVIAVEPPGGSPARRLAPFRGDRGEPDAGLWWQAYARGTRCLVLDLESDAGRARFMKLVADTDFLIESFTSDRARQLNLHYDQLARVNPGLIWISISPFGRTGPKADWPATDLTVWASSGAHALAGDDDRAPVRTSVPQSFLHAGADAAGAALIALQERHNSGRGQHVDISAQQSCAQAALSANLAAPNNAGMSVERVAGGLRANFPIQLTWPCLDGYVAITLLFGPAFSEANRRLLRWLHEYGACTAEEAEVDWGAKIAGMTLGAESPESYFELCKRIESFTRERSGEELFEEGLARGIYIAPTFDIAGLLDEPHFQARGFWHEIEVSNATSGEVDRAHSVPGSTTRIRVPGAFAKFSNSPLVLPGRAARFDDEASKVAWRPRAHALSARDSDSAGANALPLAGLK
ncbi:MAG: CoA transferase, partial [Myxococcota bacterium]